MKSNHKTDSRESKVTNEEDESKIRVLLADNDENYRSKIIEYLDSNPQVILSDTVSDGSRLEHYLRHRGMYDLLISEVILNGKNVIQTLSESEEIPAVIFLTIKQDFAIKAFELGVVDYLLKPVSPERFRKAIERAREQIQRKKVLLTQNYRNREFDMPERYPRLLEIKLREEYHLTDKECMVIKLLTEGMPRDKILVEMNIANDTLKQHLRLIFSKTIDLHQSNPARQQGKVVQLLHFISDLKESILTSNPEMS